MSLRDRRLASLAFANFTAGTAILIVAGLLNELAADLRVSVAAAGQLFTASSLAICIGAPLLAALTTGIERRLLLGLALAGLALTSFAAALAPGFATLVAVRALMGVCVAIITPQAAASAGVLVEPAARGRALAVVFLGFSVSTVLGVPLGTWLGALLGWRVTVAIIGGLALAAAAAVWFALPARLHVARMDRHAWRELAGSAAILLVIATTVVQGTGQFVLYSYIAPALREFVGATPLALSLFLLWNGVCGVTGNVVAGRLIDRVGPPRIVHAALALMLAAFLLWPATRGSVAITAAAIMLWGLGCFAVQTAQQTRLVLLAPQLASASIALNSSAIYLGQACGAVIGAAVINEAGLGGLSVAGALFLAAAIGVSLLAGRWHGAAGPG